MAAGGGTDALETLQSHRQKGGTRWRNKHKHRWTKDSKRRLPIRVPIVVWQRRTGGATPARGIPSPVYSTAARVVLTAVAARARKRATSDGGLECTCLLPQRYVERGPSETEMSCRFSPLATDWYAFASD